MNPKRIDCCNPWQARFTSLVVLTTGRRLDRFTSFAFVHLREAREPRPSLHRLFG